MRRRRLATVLCVVVGLAVSSGCAAKPEVSAEVVVTGEPGAAPQLAYQRPLEVSQASVEVLMEGSGPAVVDGEPILVNFYAESGADGTVINDTYSSEPRPYLLSAEVLGVDIYQALSGQKVGSRILSIAPPVAGQGSATVAVFDILPTRADGEAVAPREGLPTVRLAVDGTPTITVPDAAPPTELVVQPLQRGDGPQVAVGQVITVQFVGVSWSDGRVFDSSWASGELPDSFPIGVQSVIAGWDSALVEQPVGSQVLLVVPPQMAYGGTDDELAAETLVFVVDILSAVGGPVTDGS